MKNTKKQALTPMEKELLKTLDDIRHDLVYFNVPRIGAIVRIEGMIDNALAKANKAA